MTATEQPVDIDPEKLMGFVIPRPSMRSARL